ncbi:MAG TPA: hypothetical protein VMM76_06130 [Pirellulaceae bacterium]|nr:hypothetical protein [Pirellulaceae bacterium]
MALDVHVVDAPSRQGLTGEWPACQFEEPIHSYIFHGAGVDVYSRFAYLRRMIDFYADASYSKDELSFVVAEIDRLLPHLAANKSAVDTLKLFRTICVDAREAGKSVFLYCD